VDIIISQYLAAGLMTACLNSVPAPERCTEPQQQQTVREAPARLRPVTTFGYLDADRDGRISRQEARADWAVHQRFAEADRNRDSYIDEEEFKRLIEAAPSEGPPDNRPDDED
jgi:hypothetical protein